MANMVATPLDKSSSIILHVLLPFDICVPSQYIFVHSRLITGWLNLITHDPLCPVTDRLTTPGQLVMSRVIDSSMLVTARSLNTHAPQHFMVNYALSLVS